MSQNRYTYAENDPINHIDPSGHYSQRGTYYRSSADPGRAWTYSEPQKPKKSRSGRKIVDLSKFDSNNHQMRNVVAKLNSKATQKNKEKFKSTSYSGSGYRHSYHSNGTPEVYSAYTVNPLAHLKNEPVKPTIQSTVHSFGQSAYDLAKNLGHTVHQWNQSKLKEAEHIHRAWSKALEKIVNQFCNPDTIKSSDKQSQGSFDWSNFGKASLSYINDLVGNLGDFSGLFKLGSNGLARTGGILRLLSSWKGLANGSGYLLNPYSPLYKAGSQVINTGKILNQISEVLDSKWFNMLGFGLGMANDMINENKTFGQAATHNGVALDVGAGATALSAALLGTNPAGWAILGSAAIGWFSSTIFDYAYSNNILGIQEGLDWLGERIDDGIQTSIKFGKWLGEKAVQGIDSAKQGINWLGEKAVQGIDSAKQGINWLGKKAVQGIDSAQQGINWLGDQVNQGLNGLGSRINDISDFLKGLNVLGGD